LKILFLFFFAHPFFFFGSHSFFFSYRPYFFSRHILCVLYVCLKKVMLAVRHV
jgi:hypothetical protein